MCSKSSVNDKPKFKPASSERAITSNKSSFKTIRSREITGIGYPKKNVFIASKDFLLHQRDLKGNTGCVNAVEFSPNEEWIVSGGDDKMIRLWRTVDCYVATEPKPILLKALHYSNIFALRFSHKAERVYSAGNDFRLIVHDVATKEKLRQFRASGPIYRISAHPTNDFIIAAASEEGYVHIFDQRANEGEGSTKLKQSGSAYSVEYNPQYPNLVAVCSRAGLRIYDLRNGRDDYCAEASKITTRAVCADWSPCGTSVFCIRTNSSPVYFNLNTSEHLYLKDPDYNNFITVKSCTFANHDFVVTGSDNWKIFIWKIPHLDKLEYDSIENAYSVLEGHRSVVNHVRYGLNSDLLISCGVEKIIKCWSNSKLTADSYTKPKTRSRNSLPRSRLLHYVLSQDMDEPNTEEDSITLQHFDQYLDQAIKKQQRDRNGNNSDSSLSSNSSLSGLESFIFDSMNLESDDNGDDESFLSSVPSLTDSSESEENDLNSYMDTMENGHFSNQSFSSADEPSHLISGSHCQHENLAKQSPQTKKV